MKNTKMIEWCDHTVNLWWGCSEVSEACQNCYAREIAKRFKKDCWGKSQRIFRFTEALKEIRRLNNSAKKRGVIETVFVNSMSDFFDGFVHEANKHLALLDFKYFSNLLFLILTKRAHCLNSFTSRYNLILPKNARFGITAENQRRLDERMAELAGFKGKVFLSCEPLLEEIDITPYLDKIDWVICGGETGRNARYFNPMWAQKIFEDTHKFDDYTREWTPIIPFFFKKFGDNKANLKTGEEWYISTIREYPEWHTKGGRSGHNAER